MVAGAFVAITSLLRSIHVTSGRGQHKRAGGKKTREKSFALLSLIVIFFPENDGLNSSDSDNIEEGNE